MCVCVCENTVGTTNWKGNLVKDPENLEGSNLHVHVKLVSNVKHLILALDPNIQHLNFLKSEV